MKPKIIVGTIAWGEAYVRNLARYALPSWLSPGNLPVLFEHFDGEFRIYTREEDMPILDECKIGQELSKYAPIKIFKMEIGNKPPVNITHDIYHDGIIAEARAEDAAVVYLTPDLLWADGSLGYIGKSLASGNVMVLAPDYRVVLETIETEMIRFLQPNGTIKIPLRDARRLLVQHLSPLTGCYHVGGQHVPDHGEILIWPVGNEGLLFYNLSKDSHFFWPARIKYTRQNLPDEDNDFSKFDIVQSSNLALGMSLTPVNQNLNWLRQGKPFDPVRIAQFLIVFFTVHNGTRMRKPVVLPLVDDLNAELWEEAEKVAIEQFDLILRCANALLASDITFPYPPPPPLPGGPPPTDIDLCQDALKWLEPVIDERFSQRVLSYLVALRRKFPSGDLPGYCSSWPTVLPPSPWREGYHAVTTNTYQGS